VRELSVDFMGWAMSNFTLGKCLGVVNRTMITFNAVTQAP